MCYHLSCNRTQKELEKRFGDKFAKPNLFSPIYYANGFEAPKIPVITNDNPFEIQMLTWGITFYTFPSFYILNDNNL